MRLEIRGHNFPGRKGTYGGRTCDNVHVGIQIGRQASDLIPGDAEQATWSTEIEIIERDGTLDFRGPAVQGKRGERFVYLSWGDVAKDGTFTMIGRAKLMLDDAAKAAGSDPAGRVIADLDLTNDVGEPRFARLRAPAITILPG